MSRHSICIPLLLSVLTLHTACTPSAPPPPTQPVPDIQPSPTQPMPDIRPSLTQPVPDVRPSPAQPTPDIRPSPPQSVPDIRPSPAQSPADIRLHYLGHSSFILGFDNGVTILTDYGKSRAYGLASPIYALKYFQPTLVTYSHHHEDHDRGAAFANATKLDGQDLSLKQIDIKAIPVSENREGDNYGYLITYKGYTLFHAGDSQGDIVNLSTSTQVQQRLKRQLPAKIDLLLVPIDWTKNIVAQAIEYVNFLQPRQVIPIHYWSPAIKSEFLTKLGGQPYKIVEVDGPQYGIVVSESTTFANTVISLTPDAYEK